MNVTFPELLRSVRSCDDPIIGLMTFGSKAERYRGKAHVCRLLNELSASSTRLLPPHRYLSSLRMQRAKALLANPAMSVTQIGFNLGFSETSSSMTAFRKHIGLTPTAYRRGLG